MKKRRTQGVQYSLKKFRKRLVMLLWVCFEMIYRDINKKENEMDKKTILTIITIYNSVHTLLNSQIF